MSYISLIVLLLYGLSFEAQAQQPCTTPEGLRAQCVLVKQCPTIRDILTNAPRPLPQTIISYLQQLQCSHPTGQAAVCCRQPLIIATQPTQPIQPTEPVQPSSSGIGPVDVSRHPNINILPLNICGPILNDKISNGNKTDLFEFPWMALLRYQQNNELDYKCGGSLITKRYVLTAAHCVSRLRSDTTLYSVILGEHTIGVERDCQQISATENFCAPPVQEIFVESSIPHPQYNTPRFSNDIALIRLSTDADMSEENVRPVCLPITSALQNFPLKRVTVTGWGTTETQRTSLELLQAILPIVSLQDCQAIFRTTKLSENQFCAGGEGNVDSCKGDSGGPLTYPANLRGQQIIQFGIVSAGIETCGNSGGRPGLYVKVGNYVKWIMDNLQP